MVTESTISVNNYSLAYKHYPANGPTILCLHGWLDNADSFSLIAPYLDNYNLIALDLPGHGKSSQLIAGAHYHFIDSLTLLISLVDALTEDKIILLGHSLGGAIASMSVPFLKDKVTKLILLDAIGPISGVEDDACENYQAHIQALSSIATMPARQYASLDEAAYARAKRGRISFELAKILADRGTKKTESGYEWCHDRRLLLPSALKMTQKQILSFLKEVTQPTLLIEASNGIIQSHPIVSARKEAISLLSLESINAGHHLHMEKPEQTANMIKNFLKAKISAH